MRLNRYLSQCGIASRRGAEQIISEGRVSINGHVITNLATQVAPEDRVIVDGKPVKSEQPVVLALHKPKGYICSRGDTHDRMTVYDLLPDRFQNLHHVGRLDKESDGLLLMTNRGDLSHRLIHPSMGAEKEYVVVVDKPMDQDTMARLVKGMMTEEGHARVERAWLDGAFRCHLVLKQGLKRQIRLMMYFLGFEVQRLTRIRIGWLQLRGLQLGGWKEIKPADVERFFKDVPEKPRMERERAKPAKASAFEDEAEVGDDDFAPAPRRSPTPRGKKPFGRSPGPVRRPAAESEEGPKRIKPKRDRLGAKVRSYEQPRDEKPRGRSFGPKKGPPKEDGPKKRFGSKSSFKGGSFKTPRSKETGRDEKPRGRSGPPARRPAPRGPRRGPK